MYFHVNLFRPTHVILTLSILSTTVPEDYDINPQTSRRGDRSHHPELRSASVEYVAPSEYMVRERENDRFSLIVSRFTLLVPSTQAHVNFVVSIACMVHVQAWSRSSFLFKL